MICSYEETVLQEEAGRIRPFGDRSQVAEKMGAVEDLQDEGGSEARQILCSRHVPVSLRRRPPCRTSQGLHSDRCHFALSENERRLGFASYGLRCIRTAGGELCPEDENESGCSRCQECCPVQKTA